MAMSEIIGWIILTVFLAPIALIVLLPFYQWATRTEEQIRRDRIIAKIDAEIARERRLTGAASGAAHYGDGGIRDPGD
jgi:uncharacterized membrane protein